VHLFTRYRSNLRVEMDFGEIALKDFFTSHT
jgi:hypothetical protein